MFVDRVKIELQAGRGGDGCMSFRREMHVPRGGPDGGDGGDGGSLILEARHGVNSLAAYANRHFFRGPKGTHGMGAKRHGKNGKDATLLVPLGTSVIDARHGFVIRDLITEGERFVVARGGKGGRGNVHFKSSTNQAPRQRTLGEEGETRAVILELKSIADVGLIGMPNAGKSTLLSRISSARPEIADYPFTTKHPNIGIVDVTDEKAFVVADIPGLIEGASEGVGLGHEFLRHVERAGLLVHLVEPEPVDRSDAVANYQAIRHELGEYDASLGEREEIVVVTKCEFDSATQVRDRLAEATGGAVLMISSQNGTGLSALKQAILERVENRRRETAGVPAADANRRGGSAGDGDQKTNRRRVPPHLAGATAELSNDLQPHDVADPNYNKPSGGRDVDLSACRAEIPAEPHGTSAGMSPGQSPSRPSEAEPAGPSSPGPCSSQPQPSAADRERENPS